jgi:hypothetical protein
MTHLDFDYTYECSEFENAVCRSQATLFEECQYAWNVDAVDFITKFMNCHVSECMDKKHSVWHSAGIKQKGEELLLGTGVLPFEKQNEVSPEILYWVGYMYRKWAFMGASSKQIVKFVPTEKAIQTYHGYHTLAIEEAIRMYMNAHIRVAV